MTHENPSVQFVAPHTDLHLLEGTLSNHKVILMEAGGSYSLVDNRVGRYNGCVADQCIISQFKMRL